jgi:hypothetical protein
VNWEALGKEMNAATISSRIWTAKRAAKECGANEVMFRRKQKDTDRCRLRGEIESVLHVYKCKHEKAVSVWNCCITELSKDMISWKTAPDIIEQLCGGLNSWRNDEIAEEGDLLHNQTLIGWDGILEGIVSCHWADSQ